MEKSTQKFPLHFFSLLKQPFDDKSCVGYVAAMVTGTTVDDFRWFCGQMGDMMPPYTLRHFYAYLLAHGWGCGMSLEPQGVIETVPEAVTVRLPILGNPAFLQVRSKNKRLDHCVLWDGERILDPDPAVQVEKPLSDYNIALWLPVSRL